MNLRFYSRILLILLCSAPLFLRDTFAAQFGFGLPYPAGYGATNSFVPLAQQFGISSSRFQQVYSAAAFPQPVLISGISFVNDPNTGHAFHSGLSDIEISLALSPYAADQLSVSFDSNIGGSLTVVRPRGSLELYSSQAGSPISEFSTPEQGILFQTPFLYDPAQGNLLLQICNWDQGTPDPFDPSHNVAPQNAWNNTFGPDSVSRLYAFDVNATTGTTDSIGLYTFFRVEAVPEPSTIVLLAVAIGVAGACGFFKKLRKGSR